jgi:single-strand DNA-binding protein
MSFNKITIIGYLGRDPELRYTPQGTAVCKLSVATTERRKNAAGQRDEHTTWFRITIWGRQGELANEYLAKGRQVYLEGRFRLEEYTDREGCTRYSPEVTATDLQFLGNNGNSHNGSSRYGEVELRDNGRAKMAAGTEITADLRSFGNNGDSRNVSSHHVEARIQNNSQAEAPTGTEQTTDPQSSGNNGDDRNGSSHWVEAEIQNNVTAEVATGTEKAARANRNPRSTRKSRKKPAESDLEDLLSVPDEDILHTLADDDLAF